MNILNNSGNLLISRKQLVKMVDSIAFLKMKKRPIEFRINDTKCFEDIE
jgi:hypothetical protein